MQGKDAANGPANGAAGGGAPGQGAASDNALGGGAPRDNALGTGATGDPATGDRATGDRASGDRASGDRVTGDRVTGDRATGDPATGDHNAGDDALGDHLVGEQGFGGHGAGGTASRVRLRASVWMLGPAFVAAIAYVDPGNVAANFSAGARFGYLLLWVLVVANAMAALIQYQSAKLGIVTGLSLPELLGARMGATARRAFWAQAELVAAATDIAEVIGGALALKLLFGLPLLVGGVIVGVISIALLAVQSRGGQRRFELVIGSFLAVIAIGFLAGLVAGTIDWGAAAAGLVPGFDGPSSVLLAASMLGATVMPHAIYLHSALARDRHGQPTTAAATRRLVRITRWDVGLALTVAGAVNVAMLLLAAANLRGVSGTDTIEGAHTAISNSLGPVVGIAFGVGLLASGLASTSVGCYAGAVVMSGLLRVRVPLFVRRVVTLVPALVILAVGVDPTVALVLSQVLLSFGIPFALIPLVRLTGDRKLMGDHVDSPLTRIAAWTAAALIVGLNITLIVQTIAGL